jgi:hypothetical protein
MIARLENGWIPSQRQQPRLDIETHVPTSTTLDMRHFPTSRWGEREDDSLYPPPIIVPSSFSVENEQKIPVEEASEGEDHKLASSNRRFIHPKEAHKRISPPTTTRLLIAKIHRVRKTAELKLDFRVILFVNLRADTFLDHGDLP